MFELVSAPQLAPADLDPVLQSLFDEERVRAVTWNAKRLDYRVWCRASGGVLRVGGQAATTRGTRPWSVVLKVLRYLPWSPTLEDLRDQCDDGGDEPADFGYWLREAKAYDSGLLTGGGPMRAPRCLGIRMIGNDRCWVWLEDVAGTPATKWESRRFVDAARHLGVFQGAFLTRALPNHEWFCRPFIESTGPAYRAEFLTRLGDDEVWADPLIRATHQRSVVGLAKQVWKHQGALVQALRCLPKTLCHWELRSAKPPRR